MAMSDAKMLSELLLLGGGRTPDHHSKEIAFPIVSKLDCWICLYRPQDSGPEATIRKNLRRIRGQNRIANVRVATLNVCDSQIIGQMPWADDLNPIIKYEDANGR